MELESTNVTGQGERLALESRTIKYMHDEVELNPETMERLEEQRRLLLRTYELELAKDPTSRATESARSNLIALRHTIHQVYGESAALEVTGVLDLPLFSLELLAAQ